MYREPLVSVGLPVETKLRALSSMMVAARIVRPPTASIGQHWQDGLIGITHFFTLLFVRQSLRVVVSGKHVDVTQGGITSVSLQAITKGAALALLGCGCLGGADGVAYVALATRSSVMLSNSATHSPPTPGLPNTSRAPSQLLAPHGQVAVSTNWPCGHPVRPPGVIGGVIRT